MKYTLVEHENHRFITVPLNGELYSADENNKNFDRILEKVRDDEVEGLVELFSPEVAIANSIAQVSADVVIQNGTVLYRGEPVNQALSEHLVRVWDAGLVDYRPYVRFIERLYKNPNEHSREMLWQWINDHHLTVTESGKIIAYKGVDSKGQSSRIGTGDIRNGKPVDGYIVHEPGDVIEKSREGVEFNPAVGCSFGLHVGTYNYAKDWASHNGKVFEVEVDPGDWVSTPTECESQKGRVCKYTVIREVDKPNDSYYVPDSDAEDIDDETDWDDEADWDTYWEEDEVDEDYSELAEPSEVTSGNARVRTITVGARIVRDTTKNHLHQARDPKTGRFIPKPKP